METNIKLYSKNNWNVRTSTNGNEPLFCLVDIARCLGYSAPSKAVSAHCKKGTKSLFVETKNQHGANVLTRMKFGNLGCVNKLIMKSNAPKAEQFQDWVCDEVLPSIMLTGHYESTTNYEEDKTKFNPFKFVRDVVSGEAKEEAPSHEELTTMDMLTRAVGKLIEFAGNTTSIVTTLAKQNKELTERIDNIESSIFGSLTRKQIRKTAEHMKATPTKSEPKAKYNLLIQPCRSWIGPIIQLMGHYNQVVQITERGDDVNFDITVVNYSEEARVAVETQFANRGFINIKVYKA